MTRKRTRVWAAWSGIMTVVATSLLLTTSTAAQGADPAQICSADRPSGALEYTTPADGWPQPVPGGQGQVYLFYEGETGHNCAVTTSNDPAAYVDVGLRHAGDAASEEWNHGDGPYAGPVYLEAPDMCVDTTGAVGDRSVTETGTNCGS